MTTDRATLYEHEDGRYAAWPGTDSPPWTNGDPAWHRVGPVDVSGLSAAPPVAQEAIQPCAHHFVPWTGCASCERWKTYRAEQRRGGSFESWKLEKERNALAAPQPSQGAEEALALGLKTRAFQDVVYERMRQCRVEGWTPMHDDEHTDGSLSVAAACYALAELNGKRPSALSPLYLWKFTGWDESWWKPAGRRRNLVKAGALILAELERLDRADGTFFAAAPQPQPEPTSKGMPLTEEQSQPWYDLAWKHGASQHINFAGDELDALTFSPDQFDAFCAELAASQQRETQEAAEPATQDAWPDYIAGIIETYVKQNRTDEDREKGIAGIIRRRMHLAPKEASKAEPDMRAICEALGFDPTNHHNAAKCPYCRPPEPKEAGKVEPVAEEPFGWFYEMDRKANPKAGPVYLGGNDQRIVQTVADDEGATAFPLYLRPSQQALSDAHVRAAGGIVHRDGNIFFTNIAQLNAAIRRTAALERMARLDDEMGIEP